jgi:NHL repeat
MNRIAIPTLLILACSLATAGEVKFASKPAVSKAGGKVKIAFAVSCKTDVEVAILDAKGKVVRHLAAGVLGAGKVAPPLVKGLSQSLTWDGRDDFKKPAKGGPFKVRVRAGTGFKFGRFIGADPYVFGGVNSVVLGADGNVYMSGFGGPANQGQNTLRVFRPDGRFLRTLLPFPANLKPGAMKEIARWDGAAKSWRPRNLSSLNPSFYKGRLSVLAATKDSVLLAGGGRLYRIALDGSIPGKRFELTGMRAWPSDKEWPKRDALANALNRHRGSRRYSASLDGKYLYLSGPFPRNPKARKLVPLGSVWRMKLDGSDSTMKPFVVVPATANGPWSKRGATVYGAGSGPIHGVSTDSKGNVYICDREKSRVAVYSEAGKLIGEIAVKNPDAVSVHPMTGAIYVIRRYCNGWGTHNMILEKFKNFEKGAKPAASFTKFHRKNSPAMTIVPDGKKTSIWLTGTRLGGHQRPRNLLLLVLEDRGAEFQPVKLPYGPRAGVQADFARIATDPLREELYVSNGVNLLYRYNGNTGEGGMLKKNAKPFYAPDLTVGYDGLLYVRSGKSFSGPLERLDRDLKPVPFSGIGTHKLYHIYGRYGIGYCEKGVGVGADGKVYDCWMYDFAKYFVSGWQADGKPLKGKYMAHKLKTSKPVYLSIKLPPERKITTAIIGPVPADNGGIRVDLEGNIYMGMRLLPKLYVPPAGFNARFYKGFVGSVVKFRPQGGTVLGVTDARSEDPAAPVLETSKKKNTIEGGLAIYPGVAPFSGRGFGGNTSCCVCRVARFDLDSYGRLALPNVLKTSVTIVDNAGNVICEFGKYGNFDSQYAHPEPEADSAGKNQPIVATPKIPMAWPTGAGFTDKAVYVCDTYNRRIVRADKTWKAESTCNLP